MKLCFGIFTASVLLWCAYIGVYLAGRHMDSNVAPKMTEALNGSRSQEEYREKYRRIPKPPFAFDITFGIGLSSDGHPRGANYAVFSFTEDGSSAVYHQGWTVFFLPLFSFEHACWITRAFSFGEVFTNGPDWRKVLLLPFATLIIWGGFGWSGCRLLLPRRRNRTLAMANQDKSFRIRR